MQHTAQVVSLQGKDAIVQFTRSKACAHCGGCIYLGSDQGEVQLRNELNACVGDWVVIELEAKGLLRASLLMYILPLCMLLLGIAIGVQVSDVLGIVLGLGGAALVYLVLRLLEPKFQRMPTFKPRMISFGTQPDNPNEKGGTIDE